MLLLTAASISGFFWLAVIGLPGEKYEKAGRLMENGEYTAAKELFESISGYKDSAEKAAACEEVLLGIDYYFPGKSTVDVSDELKKQLEANTIVKLRHEFDFPISLAEINPEFSVFVDSGKGYVCMDNVDVIALSKHVFAEDFDRLEKISDIMYGNCSLSLPEYGNETDNRFARMGEPSSYILKIPELNRGTSFDVSFDLKFEDYDNSLNLFFSGIKGKTFYNFLWILNPGYGETDASVFSINSAGQKSSIAPSACILRETSGDNPDNRFFAMNMWYRINIHVGEFSPGVLSVIATAKLKEQ